MRFAFYSLSALCAVFALLQVRALGKTRHQLMLFVFSVAAVALLIAQLLFDGLFLRLPHLFLVINVFALMAIHSMYYYARWLADTRFTLTLRPLLTILGVAALYAAILSPFWFLRAAEKVLIVGEIVRLTVLYTARDPEILGISVFKLSNAYFAIVGILTFAFSCRVAIKAAREVPGKVHSYSALLFAGALLASLVGTLGIIVNSLALIIVAGISLSATFCGLYFVGELAERGDKT